MSNRRAFLDMIAHSELGPLLLAASDNGYNVLVGSTARHPILFSGYGDHPRRLVELLIKGRKVTSSAAGRYQLLARFYDSYKNLLHLTDFSPASQDAIALQQIRERGALNDIDEGRFVVAVDKVKNIWASLPGAGYNQNENKLADLTLAYTAAGGKLTVG